MRFSVHSITCGPSSYPAFQYWANVSCLSFTTCCWRAEVMYPVHAQFAAQRGSTSLIYGADLSHLEWSMDWESRPATCTLPFSHSCRLEPRKEGKGRITTGKPALWVWLHHFLSVSPAVNWAECPAGDYEQRAPTECTWRGFYQLQRRCKVLLPRGRQQAIGSQVGTEPVSSMCYKGPTRALTWRIWHALGRWGEGLWLVADGVAHSADVDVVDMLRAQAEMQVGTVGWDRWISASLLPPAVSYMVPFLHFAGQHQAAVSILLRPVQHLYFRSGDLLCQEVEEGRPHWSEPPGILTWPFC